MYLTAYARNMPEATVILEQMINSGSTVKDRFVRQMQSSEYPGLYQSASDASSQAQRSFYLAFRLNLALLVCASVLSFINIPHSAAATAQALVLFAALVCSAYLSILKPEKHWYYSRATAESIKSITWRYISRAEPYDCSDAIADGLLVARIRELVKQNKDIAHLLNAHLEKPIISDEMRQYRRKNVNERKELYSSGRIKDQLEWYANKARFNKVMARRFFLGLLACNACAVIFAIVRIQHPAIENWPTDVFVTSAAALLSWLQSKRFSELSASYTLTANEIGLVKEQATNSMNNKEFSMFVGDAENAFSREHTQWLARKDA